MNDKQKTFFSNLSAQFVAIVLSAGMAGLFTFFQSLASQSGVCPEPIASIEQASLLGASFKGFHTAFIMRHAIM